MLVRAAVAVVALVAVAGAGAAVDTGKTALDRFTATTVAMTPRGETLRVDVRQWSDDEGRAAVLEALGRGAETPKALAGLPTLGYVWRGRSSVGYAIKYAYRQKTPTGERVTFVTDKRLGSYDLERWATDASTPPPDLGYSVLELYLNGTGSGDGTLSLAAEVKLDAAAHLVSLAPASGSSHVLTDAKAAPSQPLAGGG